MAHHKRKGPKSTRAGCLLCKPQKRQGAPLAHRERHGDARRRAAAEDRLRTEVAGPADVTRDAARA